MAFHGHYPALNAAFFVLGDATEETGTRGIVGWVSKGVSQTARSKTATFQPIAKNLLAFGSQEIETSNRELLGSLATIDEKAGRAPTFSPGGMLCADAVSNQSCLSPIGARAFARRG